MGVCHWLLGLLLWLALGPGAEWLCLFFAQMDRQRGEASKQVRLNGSDWPSEQAVLLLPVHCWGTRPCGPICCEEGEEEAAWLAQAGDMASR